jgi:hypothetical protein
LKGEREEGRKGERRREKGRKKKGGKGERRREEREDGV